MRITNTALFILICFCPLLLFSQMNRDITSIRGSKYFKLISDFSNGIGEFRQDTLANGYSIVEGAITMSNQNGNLQFIATSCWVFDKNFEIMPGGGFYNSVGPIIKESFCDRKFDSRNRNTFIIPSPISDSLYYLLYFKVRWAPELASSKTDSLFYRTIDMSERNGLGVVNDDEKLLYVDTLLNAATTAITRHENGKDWWFIPNTTEHQYLIYRIDSLGINLIDTTFVGSPISWKELSGGQTSFSTNGDYLAYVNENYGIRLMDFDQSTGNLSNLRMDTTIALVDEISLRSGVAFSGNGKYLYVNSGGFILYQYDLSNNNLNIKDTIWKFDPTRDTDKSGHPLYLNHLQLEPDCKIYGAQPNGSPYFHIIHNPNGKGEEARFELGYSTPPDHLGSTITHPHWRTATPYEDWCDTVMYTTSVTHPHSTFKDHWMVYPNPVHDELNVIYTKDIVRVGTLRLFNQQGQLVKERTSFHSSVSTMDISDLPDGIYFLHIFPENFEDNPELKSVVKKVVKM